MKNREGVKIVTSVSGEFSNILITENDRQKRRMFNVIWNRQTDRQTDTFI